MSNPNDDLSLYHYSLPEELIAQEPVQPRDSSRLLVIHRKRGTWEHRLFQDFPSYFDSNDMLVANNTKVLRARLLGHRVREVEGQWVKGGQVEFVLLEQKANRIWEGLFNASAKYVPGLCFEIPTPTGPSLKGKLIRGSADSPSGTVVAEFDRDPTECGAGQLPLPHYIERDPRPEDEGNYQTVYAKNMGSAAAPTAGLHFTEKTMSDLKAKGVRWEEVTLNVGLGTFRPVKGTDISQHVMHEEKYEISEQVAQQISSWKAQKRRVVAVGTTSVRTLESAWRKESAGGYLQNGSGRTSLFIRPGTGFEFQVVNRLLTNFHLPCSTLLMLVSAFAGRELILAAYNEAVREKYRFFSYGDAMLILE